MTNGRPAGWEDAEVATTTGDTPTPDRLDVLASEVGVSVEAELEREGFWGAVATKVKSGTTSVIAVPTKTRDKVAELVEASLERIYANPMPVPNADTAATLLDEIGEDSTGRETSKQVAGTLAALGPVLTRLARGSGRIASVAAAGTKLVPTGRAIALSTTAALGAIRIGTSTRVGTRELQVLASYLVTRLRDAGLSVDRRFVEQVTIRAYLDPTATIRPRQTAKAGYVGLVRSWTRRAFRPVRDAKRRSINRKRVAAIEQLDLPAMLDAWRASHPGDAARR